MGLLLHKSITDSTVDPHLSEIGNDRSIRVFWVRLYALLEYFDRFLYINVWASII